MINIKLTPEYYNAWDKLCLENNYFWRITNWLEYLKNSKFGVTFIDHSFFIEKNENMFDIVPLIQQNDQLYSPGFSDKKEILQEIERIAIENHVKYIKVDSNIKEYLSISEYTRILDLQCIEPTKGHKSAIKKSEKYLRYKHGSIEKFKEDYFKIAGKATRPDQTFRMLEEWIEKGNGILLEATYQYDTAGYIYIIHYKDYAYYFMSATFEEYKSYNVNHFLLWKSFHLLRSKSVRYFELGEQVTNSLHYQPTEKEFNISRFKRNFGGETIIKPQSEFFFDMNYFEEVLQNRILNYKGAVT